MRRGNLTTNLFIRLLLQDPEIVKSECIFLLGIMRLKASGVLELALVLGKLPDCYFQGQERTFYLCFIFPYR